jgi:hypothetical protein
MIEIKFFYRNSNNIIIHSRNMAVTVYTHFVNSFEPEMMASESIQKFEFDDIVASILLDHKKINTLTTKAAYFTPKIPSRKLKNATAKKPYRTSTILKPEDIWVILDDTNMGSAKDGVIVTGMGIFWHEVAENSGALPWRIADSRVSGFVYESGMLSGELSAIIDGSIVIPLWKNSVTSNKAMEKFTSLLNNLSDYANSLYYASIGEEVPLEQGIDEELAGLDLDPAVMEAVMSGQLKVCPSCDQLSMMRRSAGGRAAKGLARGFAKYARWEAGQMGMRSIVGNSGGIFDKMTGDAAYTCTNCGFSE